MSGRPLYKRTVKDTGQTEGHSKMGMIFDLFCFSVKVGRECDSQIDYLLKPSLLLCVSSPLHK